MTKNTEPLIACRGIRKTYGAGATQAAALRGVDLEVHAGELLMLVGPSGCGKTTLISIIGGMLDADGGACMVLGRDMGAMHGRERAQFRGTKIGFVFQSFNLLPALNAAENVSIPLLLQGRPRKDAERQARAMLERVGLGGHFDALPTQMSGGQQQRVAIARALVHEPSLIVCDEPTSSLDHDTGHNVMQTLHDAGKAPGRALVVVTHDPRIFGFADRIARMDDGRIVAIDTTTATETAP